MKTQSRNLIKWLPAGASVLLLLAGCGDTGEDGEGGDDTGVGDDTGGMDTGGMEEDTGGNEDDTGGDDEGNTPDFDCDDELAWADQFLADNCVACHNPDYTGPNAGFIDVSFSGMVVNGQVRPGIATESPLFLELDEDEMPPGVTEGTFDDQAARMGNFIDACLDNSGDVCQPLPFMSLEEQLTIVEDDLRDLDRDGGVDTETIRYISLADISNQGICGSLLESYKQSAGILINSLSPDPQVTPLEEVDDTGLIFRIDIDDFQWDEAIILDDGNGGRVTADVDDIDGNAVEADRWEMIMQSDDVADQVDGVVPFNYPLELDPDGDFQVAVELANTRFPMVLSAQFSDVVANARDGLYLQLSDAPPTFDEFLAGDLINGDRFLLDDGVFDNLEDYVLNSLNNNDDQMDRYFVQGSGVTINLNRIVEFFEDADGGKILTATDFDDLGSAAAQELPVSGNSNVFGQIGQSYQVVKVLDNGLYMSATYELIGDELVLATEAPVDTIADQFNDVDSNQVTGQVSCIGCHSDNGFKRMADGLFDPDTIIDAVDDELDDNDLDAENLYSDRGDLEDEIEDLNRDYQNAINDLDIDLIPPPGSVMINYIQFDKPLTLSTAAAEAGSSENELLRAIDNLLADGVILRGSELDLLSDEENSFVSRATWGAFYVAIMEEIHDEIIFQD